MIETDEIETLIVQGNGHTESHVKRCKRAALFSNHTFFLMILLTLGAAYASSSFDQQSQIHPRSTNHQSIFTDRSIYAIIWSCLATIFACTWISVHPNVPAPQDGALRVFGRRLAIMGYLLIAPEMVIVWTTRQWLGASEIYERHKNKGWTKVHAFFLLMGGFSLYENGVLLRTLETREFEKLVEEGKIDWPSITEEEINDKSKVDPFSKGVVILQTTWFIIQCIMRGAKHLVLTELEVVTLAFASLTMGIYALWWHKPMDVQVSVPIHLKAPQDVKIEEQEAVDIVDLSSQPTERGSLEEESQLLPPPIDVVYSSPPPPPPPPPPRVDEADRNNSIEEKPAPTDSEPAPKKRFSDPNLTPWQNLRAYFKSKREEHGLFSAIVYVFIRRPGIMFFGAFIDMLFCTTLEGRQFRVPTFYAPAMEDDSISMVFAIFVALVFGGIHCIAWRFHFASWTERWIWRISAVLVSGLPVSISVMSTLYLRDDENLWARFFDNVLTFILMSSVILYIAARVALLILPLIALRALPPGAFVDINWAAYLPHI